MIILGFIIASVGGVQKEVATASAIDSSSFQSKPLSETMSPEQLFALSEELLARGNTDTAMTILKALEKDNNPEYRAEARVRIARIYGSKGDYNAAALWYQRILAEKPDTAGVRIELAAVLAKLGDEGAAGRQIRRAAAMPGIPEEVARALGRLNANLRSNAPFVGNIELGIAPDSNINRATQSRQIDLFGLPFQLNESARETSGVGLTVNASGVYRRKIGTSARLNFQIAGSGNFYRQNEFNDVSASSSIGPEIYDKKRTLSLPIAIGRRWIGQQKLYDFVGLSASLRFILDPKSQLQTTLSINHFEYSTRRDLTGNLYALVIAYERVITPTLSIRAGINVNSNEARSRINSRQSLGSEFTISKDMGSFTLFGKGSYSITEGNVPFFPFSDIRKDKFYEGEAGVIFRKLSIFGLSPLIRAHYSKSSSSITLFDYKRKRLEMAVTRTF